MKSKKHSYLLSFLTSFLIIFLIISPDILSTPYNKNNNEFEITNSLFLTNIFFLIKSINLIYISFLVLVGMMSFYFSLKINTLSTPLEILIAKKNNVINKKESFAFLFIQIIAGLLATFSLYGFSLLFGTFNKNTNFSTLSNIQVGFLWEYGFGYKEFESSFTNSFVYLRLIINTLFLIISYLSIRLVFLKQKNMKRQILIRIFISFIFLSITLKFSTQSDNFIRIIVSVIATQIFNPSSTQIEFSTIALMIHFTFFLFILFNNKKIN